MARDGILHHGGRWFVVEMNQKWYRVQELHKQMSLQLQQVASFQIVFAEACSLQLQIAKFGLHVPSHPGLVYKKKVNLYGELLIYSLFRKLTFWRLCLNQKVQTIKPRIWNAWLLHGGKCEERGVSYCLTTLRQRYQICTIRIYHRELTSVPPINGTSIVGIITLVPSTNM